MARHGLGDPKIASARASPHLEEVEEKNWSQWAGSRSPEGSRFRHPLPVRRCPSRRLRGLRTAEARRPGTTARTPAPLKGYSHARCDGDRSADRLTLTCFSFSG